MNSSPVLLTSCLSLLLISGSLISGSLISGPLAAHDRITTKVTWEREIAPIVRARCVTCHTASGRGPMPLTTYEEARPWAKAIKDEVLARRMPKWPVVRGYGDFKNDPSLSAFEIALIAAWADGGAPRLRPGAVMGPSSESPVAAEKAPNVRSTTADCSARALPMGLLVAVKPQLAKGESLRQVLVRPDGTEEPLVWVRDFDPAFAEIYWLRHPLKITRGTRLRAEGPVPCTFTLLLAAGASR